MAMENAFSVADSRKPMLTAMAVKNTIWWKYKNHWTIAGYR